MKHLHRLLATHPSSIPKIENSNLCPLDDITSTPSFSVENELNMAVTTEELVQEVMRLHKAEKYEEILDTFYNVVSSGDHKDKNTIRLLLWPAPTLQDLIVLNGFIISREISHVYSIGCGTGLLEWLLLQNYSRYFASPVSDNENSPSEEPTDMEALPAHSPLLPLSLTAVEVDSQWWANKYAPPVFYPHSYAAEDFPQGTPFGTESDLIIFSYFNSLKVFAEYLRLFRGIYVVIIGPTQKQYCAPNPTDLKTNSELPIADWNMILFQRFGLEPFDYIAIYSKAEQPCL